LHIIEDFEDYLRTNNVFVHVVPLRGEIYAFVYYSRKGRYHVLINEAICCEAQHKFLLHELKHIIIDMPGSTCIVGMDMQRYSIEETADQAAEHYVDLVKFMTGTEG
jgi:Zn-dependent peptidase ImmA (M78 family)